jgi:hypothetical protein
MRELQAQSRVAGKPSIRSMPIEKHNNGNSAKPLTPNLSSAFRQTKSPLTPKVFGSSNASPNLSAKRSIHTELAASKRNADGQSTPTFGGNITPRSVARKSRIGTESPSTPDGNNAARSPWPKSVVERDRPKDVTVGLGVSSVGLHAPGSPAPAGTSSVPKGPLSNRNSSGSVDGLTGLAPATPFFHANDAKSAVSTHSADEGPKPGARAATFFYANEAAAIPRNPESPRPISRDIMKPDDANKFFYANEHQSGQAPSVRPGTAGKPTSPSIHSPRFPSPEVQRNGKPIQRPPSPLKESSCTSAPTTSSSPRSNTVANPARAVRHENPIPSAKQQGPIPRRASLSSTTSVLRKAGHQKSASTTSAQISPVIKPRTPDETPPKRPMGLVSPKGTPAQHLAPSMTSPTSPELSTSNSTSIVSTDTIPSSLTLDTGQAVAHASPLQSPTKSRSQPQPPAEQLQKMNELAANARRERKVLDLEISNSSLLAINKTLEREMRKQSAELRRFRRLSRSGRFSIATDSLRSMSGQSQLSALTEKDDGTGKLSDLDEMSDQDSSDSDESDDDVDLSFEDDSSADLSPSFRAHDDARHRAKDEKRLMLDLSKHQQLLIDSQKMSQSIKKCLAWTEDLISEGNKALQYQVKVSDVKLGGRVLSRDDEEDEVGALDQMGESSKGLLSPSATIDMREDTELWANALSQLDGEPERTVVDGPEVLQPD